MSNADKLFEELGYKKSLNKVGCEFGLGGTFGYRNKAKCQIVFYDTEEIVKFDENFDIEGIDMQELKAINMKCKELGWLGDEDV